MNVVTFAVVALAAFLSAFTGLSAGGASKMMLVLPMAFAFALGLGVLALTRFSVYVTVLLVARASVDLAKLSGPAAGTTTTDAGVRALDPSSLLAVMFLLAAALWLTAQYRARGSLPGSPLRRALVTFVAACFLSVVGSRHHLPSLLEAVRICAAVVMFVVLEQTMLDRARMRRLLLAIYLSTVFPLAFTAMGFLTGKPRSETKGSFVRIVGPFNQSNTFGRYLMLMIIFGAAIYPNLQARHRRPLAMVLVTSGIFLVLTYTRSALIATVLGLFMVGLLQSKRLLLFLGVVAMCSLVAVPQLASRFTELAPPDPTELDTRGNSLAWRFSYWTEVLSLAESNPVTGIGLAQTQYSTDNAKQPHNDFVRAYVETGIIGFLAYLAVMVSIVVLAARAVRASERGTFDRGVAVGFMGCAVAFVAVSIVANVMSNVVILWYFLAFAAAASNVVRRNAPAHVGPVDPVGRPPIHHFVKTG